MPDVFVERSYGATIAVVGGGRPAAAQWELLLCREDLERRRVVAPPEVLSYRAFAERLWAACRDTDDPVLLTPRQSRALWERVIAESPEAARLLGTGGTARAAEDAWRRAAAYRIELDGLLAEHRFPDFVAFVRWCREYRSRLADARWIDAAALDGLLAEKVARGARLEPFATIGLADFEPAPSERAVLDALRSAGVRIRSHELRPTSGRAVAVRCADPADELEAAADWAADALRERPDARFAIVLPDLDERRAEAARVLETRLRDVAEVPAPYFAVPAGRADTGPLVGAALNALELLSPNAGFAELGRWLRSPFWQRTPQEQADAARFEARWREAPAAQLPFLAAYRQAGLRERLHAAVPDAARRLDTALDVLRPIDAPRLPSEWAALWPRALEALGGLGLRRSEAGSASELERLERALLELAALTPIVGEIGVGRALAELERGLVERSLGPMTISGIHVLADLDDVGPGYAGVWVAGAVDTRLPAPVRVNPFLPLRVQIDRGMPWSSPADALKRSRELVARVSARTPLVVFSWPARVRDETIAPSPLLRGLETAAWSDKNRASRRRNPAAVLEIVEDRAPPLEDRKLAGGSAALTAQAVCPMRAFCEHRLGARALPPVSRGLSSGMRGKALHGALERFYRQFDGHAALAAAGSERLGGAARRAARAAVAEALGPTAGALTMLAELETERIAMLIARLAARELARMPFRVDALEREAKAEICGKTLRLRIDRIDLLDDGTIAIIDYKSGSHVRPSDWTGERPRDVQLPLYAIGLPMPPGAIVLAVLRADRVGYAGVWTPSNAFPGRAAPLGPIDELVDRWRIALERLVDEYTAGDVRLFTADAEAAAGPFAPLTRVYEQLAIAEEAEHGPEGASR